MSSTADSGAADGQRAVAGEVGGRRLARLRERQVRPAVSTPNIQPFARGAATVAFVFSAPFTEFVDYRFRVVYSPPGGTQVARSWLYKWAP